MVSRTCSLAWPDLLLGMISGRLVEYILAASNTHTYSSVSSLSYWIGFYLQVMLCSKLCTETRMSRPLLPSLAKHLVSSA